MADVFTQIGEEFATDWVDGTDVVPSNWYIAWGTGAGTAAKGDTALSTEASESRGVASMTQPTTDANKYTATMTADGAKTITNAGVLSEAVAGILWVHSDFTGIALDPGDKIEFNFTLTWS